MCCEVIGFDNNYFMIFLKKILKPLAKKNKAATSVRKDLKGLSNFGLTTLTSTTIATLSSTTSHFTQKNNTIMTKISTGVCTRFYTMSDGFDNYMCLGCCE